MKPIIALIYDFDRTLCDQDMQNYSFIPNLGLSPKEFWAEIDRFSHEENMESILSYLYFMCKKGEEKGFPVTKEYLASLGKDVKFYPGVLEWFDRINKFGEEQGCQIEHYIISSGIKEIINNTAISDKFKAVYACDFYYDEDGKAIWPKIAINFTLKTQYIYKINKGILDDIDSTKINQKQVKKRIPMRNMIYIGDGVTDIPCMTMLKKNGGRSIGLYADNNKKKVQQFLVDDRINFICDANYEPDSRLDKIVKLIIKSTCLTTELNDLESFQTILAEDSLEEDE